MPFECVARSHVGRRRSLNEDAVLAMPEAGLWAVADGMGGHDAGEVASALVVERLRAPLGDDGLAARVAAIRDALHGANADLVSLARTGPQPRTIGATVVLLAADDRRYACLWAGDSRAYLVRDGGIAQLTRDHSLVQELVDAGLLAPEEAVSHPDAHIIRRAVGAEARLDLDGVDGELRRGDVFLLASDGLTRLLGDAEILAVLNEADLAAAADRLIAETLERGAPDNVSVVLIRSA